LQATAAAVVDLSLITIPKDINMAAGMLGKVVVMVVVAVVIWAPASAVPAVVLADTMVRAATEMVVIGHIK
jgi:hypothetical protein